MSRANQGRIPVLVFRMTVLALPFQFYLAAYCWCCFAGAKDCSYLMTARLSRDFQTAIPLLSGDSSLSAISCSGCAADDCCDCSCTEETEAVLRQCRSTSCRGLAGGVSRSVSQASCRRTLNAD